MIRRQLGLCILLSVCVQRTMISKLLRAVIIGPPGSGKHTISSRIVKDFGKVHLSSGDVLRDHIRNGTATGKKVKRYLENGSLVPDEVIMDLISEEVLSIKGKSWLLDGFPRTLIQAEEFMKREPIDTVLYLNVPYDVILERIQGRWIHPGSGRTYHTKFSPPKVPMKDDETGEALVQRDDDQTETVVARLQGFQKQTEPMLDFYRKHGLLEEFKGNYSNEIWPKVHAFLSTKTEPLQYTEYS